MPSYVVTGASRGIGLEFVNQLSADDQNHVFAIVRNKTTATHLTALARNNIAVLEADVTDAKALNLAAAEVSKITGGKLDYLINNAGGSSSLHSVPTQKQSKKIYSTTYFKFNVVSVVHSINAFLPLLKSGTSKKVVSLSSGLGDLDLTLQAGSTAQFSYSVAKAGLNMVVAKYAAELKSEGFVFLSLSPGVVNTSSTAVSAPSEKTIEEMKKLGGAISKIAPDFKGPLQPEESVRMQLEVIHGWTVEHSGAFVSHLGNKQWV
ncbi:hypothetical protein B0H16DRAFT_1380197 [Mycena metata]|uniref:NAD(P)-binding protein n=1 Tax=Mycena metata TaxID=1033252 RepID=A0AAD7I6K1_9AGAR|nr:hypothetical protein B0H16DRAFT_1380197 [Mycena metata]